MKIVAGSSNKSLALDLSQKLNCKFIEAKISKFADQESDVKLSLNSYSEKIYIIQSLSKPANDHIIELLFIIDIVKRLQVKEISLVIPYLGYSRQDRVIEDKGYISSFSAKVVANLLKSSIDRVITVDLHSKQTAGFFDIPLINLNCNQLISDFIINNDVPKNDLVIVAPDIGASLRTQNFAKTLAQKINEKEENIPIAILHKVREKPGRSKVMDIIGNVENKNCIIIDDIVDSGGTLFNAATKLKEHKALSVYSYVTHGVLSGNRFEQIDNSDLDALIMTDTIEQSNKNYHQSKKIKFISVATMLSEFIKKHL